MVRWASGRTVPDRGRIRSVRPRGARPGHRGQTRPGLAGKPATGRAVRDRGNNPAVWFTLTGDAMMERLFQVNDPSGKLYMVEAGGFTAPMYLEKKIKAKEVRDALSKEKGARYTVAPGPDHRNYKA